MAPINEQNIRVALSGRAAVWLTDIYVFDSVDSTNAELSRLALAGSISGKLVVANTQTEGRGRRGREWLTPADQAIAMSIGYVPGLSASQLSGLSLVVGLALVDALEALGFQGLSLKWPNDLLLGEGKLAGILVETMAGVDGLSLIIGIGVNVTGRQVIAAEIGRNIADLGQFGVTVDRNRVIAAITSAVIAFLDEFRSNGFGPLRNEWQKRHIYQNKSVIVRQGDGVINGVVSGISAIGELILDTPDGPKRFSAGEVSLREA